MVVTTTVGFAIHHDDQLMTSITCLTFGEISLLGDIYITLGISLNQLSTQH